ncbi:MAG TPA: aminotransferase class I/II-fold pyridoxal phosphate-dependent enzyme [Synergistales bacterium]|nr:aminotransferase class I/II-fold pyridoxal phosphate-dependent enzyme [Synergistales bacterium]HRV70814.1 aminotransferase class I/II-fold pyridoxal phosphate-dependent enzyme [Thermovirgaceae bacterium]MDD3830856.1 aminotransferase class I/II-fold pyridoxal phosphate-dependent enzyme [Synergistales bacterium]MDD4023798.1 aminotransferase class I/II-fold pyridoxal phosphate-dependent enzyme [Synergistales bacterium]MDD5515380.1 aminotransferase class I/II-fold pyridoxal phosphate-dependent e
MKIEPFGVEQWMNRWETLAVNNIAETCVDSLLLYELLEMSGRKEEVMVDLLGTRMTYGDIKGSERLRGLIGELYEDRDPERVLIMNGGSAANFLALFTIVGPGERVISVWPTYQQLTSIPKAFGAKVDILQLRPENFWLPDTDELEKMAESGVDLICLNNPNNPTGSLMDRETLERIAVIARKHGAWVLCDEAYRGLVHEPGVSVSSMADIYEKGVSTGSMSKVFSLAGLRSGWMTGPREFIEEAFSRRDYTTISCGPLVDALATVALENRDKITERNLKIIRESVGLLGEWIDSEPLFHWVKPTAGTTAFVGYDLDIPSDEFCVDLLGTTGTFLLPGSCFGIDKRLRFGYAYGTDALKRGLESLSGWVRERES